MPGIVVGVDGSAPSLRALAWAASEADARGCDLLVAQSWHEPVVVEPGTTSAFEIDSVVHDAKIELESITTAIHAAHPGARVTSTLIDDRPSHGLVTRSSGADLLVVGSRGTGGFFGLEIGSVSTKVARRSTVPVVVVRGGADRTDLPEVLVGVDGSECSRHALRWAADWAASHGKALVILMAWNYLEPQGPLGPTGVEGEYEPGDADAALGVIVADVLGPWNDARVSKETVCDLPARAVLQRAQNACLIVMGRHGTPRWTPPDLGSTAVQVLHHAVCPVAVIPELAPWSE